MKPVDRLYLLSGAFLHIGEADIGLVLSNLNGRDEGKANIDHIRR